MMRNVPQNAALRLISFLLLLLVMTGCADKVQIDVRVVRLDEATALASTLTAPPVADTSTMTPNQPPDSTLDAPPLIIPPPSDSPTSGIRPFFTFDPPNAQPPPTGLSSFPPGYTPEAPPPTTTPPEQFDPPTMRTDAMNTPLFVGTVSACVAYNDAGAPLYLRESGDITRDIVGIWLPTVAAAALAQNPDGWVVLQMPDSGVGWVANEFVRLEGTCTALRAPVMTPAATLDAACRVSSATGGSADLYSAPTYAAGVVGELPNTVLIGAVERTSSGWIYVVDSRGQLPRGRGNGWIFETNLNLNGNCAALPVVTPQFLSTLTPIPLVMEPPTDACSIVNRSAARINIHSGTSIDSPVMAWLNPGEYALVIVRSPNNWFLVDFVTLEGYIDAEQAELYGDCLGIAIPGDLYDPPAVLSPDLYRDCRFVPLVENAIVDIGSLRAPLDIAREYPIIRRSAGRYLILIAEGIGGWVSESLGMVRGDCARVGIPSGED